MSHRISTGGSLRIDRRFKSIGRLAIASGTTNKRRFEKLNAMLTELYEDGLLDILTGLKARRWTLQQVYQAKRAGRLPYLASEMALATNLWEAIAAWLPESANGSNTRKRYGVSFKSLQRAGVLPPSARIADLKAANWALLHGRWSGGSADWNRLRSAVSRFLTMTLGDKYHPFRRAVMAQFPRAAESSGRVPDLSPALFWRIVSAAPQHVRPAYVALAATGLRVGEYLALEPHHLQPITHSLRVPGTKTASSEATIQIGDEAWEWVRSAVPSPLRYKWLYRHWKRACTAAGAPDLTLHDLRHFYGQMGAETGLPEAKIQQALRHRDASMTRRYTRQRDRGEVAAGVASILFPQSPNEAARGA